MKRKDLAAASGLSYPYIAEIENGGKVPSQRALQAIAEALHWSPSDLMRFSESMPGSIDQMQDLSSQAPVFEMLTGAPGPERSPQPMDPRRELLVDELRDELRLLSRRVERLDAEVESLRSELARTRGAPE
jgi:transcriptional regulator with XRE-family HTH domain